MQRLRNFRETSATSLALASAPTPACLCTACTVHNIPPQVCNMRYAYIYLKKCASKVWLGMQICIPSRNDCTIAQNTAKNSYILNSVYLRSIPQTWGTDDTVAHQPQIQLVDDTTFAIGKTIPSEFSWFNNDLYENR